MTPEEIAAANENIVAQGVGADHPGVVIREIREPSVVLVLPVAYAEALSACANVGLEGAPSDVGDLAWASVSKLDEAVRIALADVEIPKPHLADVDERPVDAMREAARDDARGEADR